MSDWLRWRGTGGAAWTPADLPGLVVTLDVTRSRAAGLLWQDAAKTVPAVADGDPVRVAVCPYTAVELTAPGDSARPLLWDEFDGVHWALSFDGVDDTLAASGLSITGGRWCAWAGQLQDAGSFPMLVSFDDNASTELRGLGSTGRPQQTAATLSSAELADSVVGAETVLVGRHDGLTVAISRDGGAEATAAAMATPLDASLVRLSGRDASSLFAMALYRGVVVGGGSLSAGDIASMSAYLSALLP